MYPSKLIFISAAFAEPLAPSAPHARSFQPTSPPCASATPNRSLGCGSIVFGILDLEVHATLTSDLSCTPQPRRTEGPIPPPSKLNSQNRVRLIHPREGSQFFVGPMCQKFWRDFFLALPIRTLIHSALLKPFHDPQKLGKSIHGTGPTSTKMVHDTKQDQMRMLL